MHPAVTVRRATDDELPWIWRLVHAEYLRAGLIEPEMDGMFSHHRHLDCIPETIPLVAIENDRLAGTMTLTLDGPNGLPTDESYPVETAEQRENGRPLASCWRLATTWDCHSAHHVSSSLMHAMVRVAMDLGEPTVLMECHPRHVSYYRRRFGFESIGTHGETAGLRNAPSVLMVGGPGSYSRIIGG
jgi:hypothetical protein